MKRNLVDRRGAAHGFTLIEMMVAMSVTSVLFTIAIGLIHQTMTLAETARGDALALRSGERIARQFRADVQDGVGVTCAPDVRGSGEKSFDAVSQELIVRLSGGGEITWRAEASQATRVEGSPSGAVRREEYRFPKDFRVDFTMLDSGERAALSVSRGYELLGAARREQVRVEAVVGRMQRLFSNQEAVRQEAVRQEAVRQEVTP